MKTITIKGLEIGKGAPKIIVPIVGKTEKAILDEAQLLTTIDFDVLEWRVDHFHEVDNIDSVKKIAEKLTQVLPNKPILFTFRSAKEGGEKSVSIDFYVKLNKALAASGFVDLIDVEIFTGDTFVKEMIETAHAHHVSVIASNHDFDKTPEKDDIVGRLRKMQTLGADIPKIAVMPQSTSDVLTLLAATAEMAEKYADRPIITMSMAGLGGISRIAGETFGSAMTFGAAKTASAPGQLDIKALRQILTTLHKSAAQ
ncbi:type I 3-dehydroquinate dehydratase [Utexia brackfieldae]|uniref:type I 3-dehydroquinate dehydratase n=1 Tax=Utexia brackfieldae TaxID=3074108 RepID=UPI00370DBC6D